MLLSSRLAGCRVQVLALGDHPHSMRGRERLEAQVGDDRLDLLVDVLEFALRSRHVQVGMHAVARALALGAGAAVATTPLTSVAPSSRANSVLARPSGPASR